MDKSFKRLIAKLLLLTIPIILMVPVTYVCMTVKPMRFFDGEYGWYLQNKDYALDHEDTCRVLILGDSTAKADWLPDELSADTYNFAIGGVSPIEEYYCLNNYLQNNPPPETVVYSQAIFHFCKADVFWSRAVYFHRLSAEDVFDVFRTRRTLEHDTTVLGNKNLLDVLLYDTYSPIYYSAAVIKGSIISREQFNEGRYEEAVQNKGRTEFGAGRSEREELPLSELTECQTFSCDPLIDHYFRKIIQLCEDNGIRFIYQASPVSDVTYRNLSGEMVKGYNAYMQQIGDAYPNAVVEAELVPYNNSLFSDANHLNREGAAVFSQKMREKYTGVFQK